MWEGQEEKGNVRKTEDMTKSSVEEHKGEKKRRKTNVFYVTAIIYVPQNSWQHVCLVLSTYADVLCVHMQLPKIIRIIAADMFSVIHGTYYLHWICFNSCHILQVQLCVLYGFSRELYWK